jgi:hypothetical protein
MICLTLNVLSLANYNDQCLSDTSRREVSYAILAVSGTLEEGFPLRKNLDYDGPPSVNATFLGKALVRGHKCFLDIKNPGWREYADHDEGVLKTVNPAIVPTGCDEHANRYSIYAVDSRQVLAALAGEPRFLSIAPDMGLTDLRAADDLTYPDVKKLAKAYAIDSSLSGVESPSTDRIAFMTVTSTWMKSTFVNNSIIREDRDGIITDFPESTGLWTTSILNSKGPHDKYPEGCGSSPGGGQVKNVNSAADYNTCIDAAIRVQEAKYTLDDATGEPVEGHADFEYCRDGFRACSNCKSPARYGTDKRTARFNKVLEACQLEALMVSADITDEAGGPRFKLQGCSLG